MVVTIDGPSGVGKSTVSAAVAAALGVPHLDTGAYYRLATLVALQTGATPDSESAVLAALSQVDIDSDAGHLLLDGAPPGDRLRSPEVTAAVSAVSAHPEVRRAIVEMQRRWVADHGGSAVVEGRDIGTVVFPEAPVKVFLTADLATRARRRAADAEAAGTDLGVLMDQIAARDHLDSTRTTSPLRPADDAVVIDTSQLTVAEVVHRILGMAGAIPAGD